MFIPVTINIHSRVAEDNHSHDAPTIRTFESSGEVISLSFENCCSILLNERLLRELKGVIVAFLAERDIVHHPEDDIAPADKGSTLRWRWNSDGPR